MAINIASLRKIENTDPPLLLIYGVAGMGKTSLALDRHSTVYLQIAPERPPQGVEAVGFGELKTYGDFIQALGSLYQEEHDFTHVVIDSLDALETLIWRETCLRNNWKDLEQPGYGKGYLAADHVWKEVIEGLEAVRRDRKMVVTMLALAEATNHEEPGQQPYKRYAMKLHKRAEGLTTQAADAVMFINTQVVLKETEAGFGKTSAHATGGGTRWLFTDGRPAFVAKNRFKMPEKIALDAKRPWTSIDKFLPGYVPAETVAAQNAA
jgi:hypothetical protein